MNTENENTQDTGSEESTTVETNQENGAPEKKTRGKKPKSENVGSGKIPSFISEGDVIELEPYGGEPGQTIVAKVGHLSVVPQNENSSPTEFVLLAVLDREGATAPETCNLYQKYKYVKHVSKA